MRFRSVLTALVALAASVSLAGPVRLATSFFIPAGRTNPEILDAKSDATGSLVMASQADNIGGGRHIVITKFNAAGVRRWSRSINTPVPVTAPGQVAGKFQIMLDGEGNTYVFSPRAGNPDYPGTTEDIVIRKIDDSGTTVGTLSLVRILWVFTSQVYDVLDGQMQLTRRNSTDFGLAVTTRNVSGLTGVALLTLSGIVSSSFLSVTDVREKLGGGFSAGDFSARFNYRLVGLTQTGTTADPRMQVAMDFRYVQNQPVLRYANLQAYSAVVVPGATRLTFLSEATRMDFDARAEGLGTSEAQNLVVSREPIGGGYAMRLGSASYEVNTPASSVPLTATRLENDWLVYGQSMAGAGEFLLKYSADGGVSSGAFTISDAAAAPYYSGASLVASRGRAYLAGGPTAAGVQGLYSSFSSTGEKLYSAGITQPFTVSTSFVIPAPNNRFWTVGKTSTGLQAVTLWNEPEYFVDLSAPSSAAPGSTVTVKAQLLTPAPVGGYTFPVRVSYRLQDAPATVTVPAGETSATFTVTVKSTATAGPASITAQTNTALDIDTAHTAKLNIN